MKIFLIIFFSSFYITSNAQDSLQTLGITPMHKFFQQYADSTIIIEYWSDSYDGRTYSIISKTGVIVNTFTYAPIDSSWKNLMDKKAFPVELWHQLFARKVMYKNRPADINIFFNLKPMPIDTAKKMWFDLTKLKPW